MNTPATHAQPLPRETPIAALERGILEMLSARSPRPMIDLVAALPEFSLGMFLRALLELRAAKRITVADGGVCALSDEATGPTIASSATILRRTSISCESGTRKRSISGPWFRCTAVKST